MYVNTHAYIQAHIYVCTHEHAHAYTQLHANVETHIYPHVSICWTEFKADVFSGALWSIYIVLKEKKLICDMRIISIREEWLHILL